MGENGTTILNILDSTIKLWMTKYIIVEIFCSGRATMYNVPSDQTGVDDCTLKKCCGNPLFFSCFIIIFIFNSLKGEGLNDLKSQVEVGGSGDNMVVNDDQTTNFATTQKRRENSNEITTSSGEGGGQILDVEKPRPASATPGDNISTTSSLTNTPSNDVIDHQQSPARSPHARSWTVPGGFSMKSISRKTFLRK